MAAQVLVRPWEKFKNLGKLGSNGRALSNLIAEKIPSWSWSWHPMEGGKVQLQWLPPVGGAWIGCSWVGKYK